MTFEEVDVYCKGYETRLAREREVERLMATVLINVNRKRHAAAVSPQDVFPLYTDKHRKVDLISKEEVRRHEELRKKIVWTKD